MTASHESRSNSLLAGLHCVDNVHLIVGATPLAAARCTQSLSAGARPILIAPDTADLHYGLADKIEAGRVRWERKDFDESDLFRLGREEVGGVVDAVFVTRNARDELSARISSLCRRNRIPVNVVDAPHLCTFSLLSTHTDGPLQIGITTNGRGCKLASRIRREIASSLPGDLGEACARLGELRRRIQLEDEGEIEAQGDLDDSVDQTARFNQLVTDESSSSSRGRRMRWLSQVCEYWPLKRLATADVDELLREYIDAKDGLVRAQVGAEDKEDTPPARQGRIILAGSGPGHPHLLTRATYDAIQSADVVLADKLVPSGVMELIPRRAQVHIARKFPGNADQAQEELHVAAVEAARQGKTVVRLKQGDPYIYGRGGEEVAYFRDHGVGEAQVTVLPGLTSALSAPLFAGIPTTQRDVADQVLICTGTGKRGRPPAPPEYVKSRTVVFLMALHRIGGLVAELTTTTHDGVDDGGGGGEGKGGQVVKEEDRERLRRLWPLDTPCAVVERASCPDQRVIRTTLQHVADAVEAEGSRPPGLLVVGEACRFLHREGGDEGRAWTVEEGFRGFGGA